MLQMALLQLLCSAREGEAAACLEEEVAPRMAASAEVEVEHVTAAAPKVEVGGVEVGALLGVVALVAVLLGVASHRTCSFLCHPSNDLYRLRL